MPENAVHHATDPSRIGGRYVLRGVVGRGGMATVHRAYDEVLHRDVAVKLPHAHLATDPAFLERFRREARAAAALAHPNIVAVHDWGETEAGAYLVLQLVDGPSFREVLRQRGRIGPADALTVLGPAAAGLGAAHAAGLVHRDVKPENVLIGRDGTVRITDFGLARAAASATSTFADVLIGSPHYLSPEAVRGEPLDPRADVYALGVMLFECLTGRPPHEGDSPFATAVAHTSQRVPAPSTLRNDLDPAIDQVVVRATAMDREDRYVDAAAFGQALAYAVPNGPAPLDLDEELLQLPPHPVTARGSTLVVPAEDVGTAIVIPTPPPDRPPPAQGDVDRRAGGREPLIDGRTNDGGDHGHRPIDDHRDDHRSDTDAIGPPRRRRRGWLVLVLLTVLIGGSALGGYVLWDRVLAPVTDVPSVIGAPETDAVEQLERIGFEVSIAADRPYDLGVPEGHVLDQAPAGTARRGAVVTLALSAGPRPVEVADVLGVDRDAAVAILRSDGLEPVATERYHETVPAGAVILTDPAAGEVIPEASDIEVVISLGREPIAVPTLVGRSLDEARQLVEQAGLELEVTARRFDEQAGIGTVLEQSPDADGQRYRGDVVEVIVSDGPAPIEVPNVRGQRVADAVATLEARGFEVEIERRGGFGAWLNPDQVYDQDPAPGAQRRRGDQILLFAYES